MGFYHIVQLLQMGTKTYIIHSIHKRNMLRKCTEIASNSFSALGDISNYYFLYITVTNIHMHTQRHVYTYRHTGILFCSKFSGGKVAKLKEC